MDTLSRQPNPHLFRALPIYLVNFLFLICSTQTVGFVSVPNVHVIVFLAPLFYWTIHKPAMMPLWFIFLSGLVIDFATDSPLGLHAFGFILFYMVLFNIRRIVLSQPIFYHVIIFAFAAFGFELLRWCLVSLLGWSLLPVYPPVLGGVINVLLFIPGLVVLRMLHKFMSGHK